MISVSSEIADQAVEDGDGSERYARHAPWKGFAPDGARDLRTHMRQIGVRYIVRPHAAFTFPVSSLQAFEQPPSQHGSLARLTVSHGKPGKGYGVPGHWQPVKLKASEGSTTVTPVPLAGAAVSPDFTVNELLVVDVGEQVSKLSDPSATAFTV